MLRLSLEHEVREMTVVGEKLSFQFLHPFENLLAIGGDVVGMYAILDVADYGFKVVNVKRIPLMGEVTAVLD